MKTSSSLVYRSIILVGGFALLLAMMIDVVAVIGRYLGTPLLGSIELVQVLVGIAGAMALLVATLQNSHARVRLLLARMTDAPRDLLLRFDAVLTALFFLALAIGSAWILRDMWLSHEESELWRLPYRPLRLLVVVTLLVTTVLMLRKAQQGDKP